VSEVQVQTQPSRARTKVYCPRCGSEGYMVIVRRGNNAYRYVKHVESEGGVKKARWCYLGPDEYIYVEHFNELGLAGIHDSSRYLRYAQYLVSKFDQDTLLELGRFIVSRLNQRALLELRGIVDRRLGEVGESGA
jgi:hypothetical protein